jgi:hypothetical protein
MKWFLIAMAITTAQPAMAQTVVSFQLLPPGHDGQVQGVGRARYYLLDEYLMLSKLDAEFVKMQADFQDLTMIVEGLKKALALKDTIIQSLESDKKILADRGIRLEGDWRTCEKALEDCASGPVWPYILAAGGAVLGIVGTTLYLAKR